MPEYKKVIGFVLFVSLMFIKVSAFHVYVHGDAKTDSIENCTICNLAVENQGLEMQFTVGVPTVGPPQILVSPLKIGVNQQFKTVRFNFSLFSRPPPHSLV